MKTVKKAVAIILCVVLFATNFLATGLVPVLNAAAVKGENQTYSDARLDLNFNKNWAFALDDPTGAQAKAYDDSSWESIDLPHDFSITQEYYATGTEGESGSLPGGTGWYRKWFTIDSYYADKSIVLNFDGSYQHTYVYVNGTLVGENHYGYNSFSFDITDHIVCGSTPNLIAVKVVHELPSSRWYSGSGIHRDVTMTITNPVHVALYGTQVKTPNLSATNPTDGTVSATVTLQNDLATEQTVEVVVEVLDESGAQVATDTGTATVTGKSKQTVTLTPVVSNPTLWSVNGDNAYVYTLKTTVTQNGSVIDEYYTDFGFRYFEWSETTGFKLNGEMMKIKGVCLHSDQGALGAVQTYDSIYRQLSIMKDMGVNAIRTAHNTPSEIVLDVCNELGLLVMDEFFDGWSASKNSNSNDFSEYFNQTIGSSNEIIDGEADMTWYEFVLRQSLKRDRNEPCVFVWDIGNELTAEGDVSQYPTYAQNMYDIIVELDGSDHLPVAIGNNRPVQATAISINEIMDITGANYHLHDNTWLADARDTTKPFVAAESASTNNSRGIYDTTDCYNYQCTAYDTKCVGWGSYAAEAWYHTIVNDWFSGEFVWTGFDYLGEPTPWNPTTYSVSGQPVSSFFGICDTAGFEKDSYYLYRSWWNETSDTVHLVPGSWVSSELTLTDGYANVAVYSNASRIELYLNDTKIAEASATEVTTEAGFKYYTWEETVVDSSKCKIDSPIYTDYGNEFYPQFQVLFEEGTLSVKAYDENGNLIENAAGSQKSVTTTATKIDSSVWNEIYTYTADGQRYAYVEFEAQDADGNFVNDYNGTLTIEIGDTSSRYAEIVGVDNGNAATTDKFQQPSVLTSSSSATIQMFNGKALAIIRTTEEEGTITVTAHATDGSTTIQADGVTVTSVTETDEELSDEFEEVIVQQEINYTPTTYDIYEVLKSEVEALDENTGLNTELYTRYLAVSDSTLPEKLPDGYYIITGQSYLNYSYGALTHTLFDGSVNLSTANAAVTAASDTWYFEWRSGTGYNIYFDDENGTRYYMDFEVDSSSEYNIVLTESEPANGFDVTVNSDGTVTIGMSGTGYYINYSGNTTAKSNPWTTATTLTLYVVNDDSTVSTWYTQEDVIIPDGDYAIYHPVNNSGSATKIVVTGTVDSSGTGLTQSSVADTLSDDALTFDTSTENEYTITHVSDNLYTIMHKDSGLYLNIGTSNSSVTLSETAQSLTISPRDDGSVYIYNGSQFLDNFGTRFDSWSSSESAGNKNEIFYLYTAPPRTDYIRYSATNDYVPSGQYVIVGESTDGVSSIGAMTGNQYNSSRGLLPDGNMTPSEDSFQWTVERQSSGAYYIYYTDDSGANQYITISGGKVWLNTSAASLYFLDQPDGRFDIHNSGAAGYVQFYDGEARIDRADNGGLHFILYRVLDDGSFEQFTLSAPIADDDYVILDEPSDSDYDLVSFPTVSDSTYTFAHEDSENLVVASDEETLQTDAANEFTFTNVGNNSYYITASDGSYLNLGTANGTLTLSDTPQAVSVYAFSEYEVSIHNGNQFVDNYTSDGKFSTWKSTIDSATANRKFTLYKDPEVAASSLNSELMALYQALTDAIVYSPESYTAESYGILLTAVQTGLNIYNDEDSEDAQITAITATIYDAIDELEINIKKHEAVLYKYGYNNTSGQNYTSGGGAMNDISINRMEAMIAADENIVSQIKTIIDYDGTNGTEWGEGYADIALEAAIRRYAELYSLQFTGAPVKNSSALSNFHKTAWNNWAKTNTHGANDAAGDQGASVQGLASATLVDGELKSHAAYTQVLPYINVASSNSITSPVSITVTTSVTTDDDGNETTNTESITLDALSNISVYSPDYFDKENLLTDDTVTTETTGNFAKFYWDTEMPFLISTDSYGVNTYSYSSDADNYIVRTCFDDEEQTAVMDIESVDSWDISAGNSGKGFFPFNYQSDGISAQSTSELTDENAIYHFGMTFENTFYIPASGTYANGEDIVFSFMGDDDVYVYIDDVLVLDNGGLHGARSAVINFTDCSVEYQYALDVTEGTIKSETEYGTVYTYGAENEGISADNLAALEKLNEVRTGGGEHTFTFFYLERGSTDSNCLIEFNLAETSEDVKLNNQVLSIDYALPVEYDVKSNNTLSPLAIEHGATYEYIGISAANSAVESAYNFEKPELAAEFTDSSSTLNVTGLNHGTCTVTKDGVVRYSMNTFDFTGSDYFYLCAKVSGDPTYAENIVYYQYEKVTFIPATTIYFEDTFETITYTDGSVPADYTNTNQYGIWQQEGTQSDALMQTADIVDSESKPYGYEVNYQSFATFSGGSTHYVDVSTKNNPNSKYSGGTGGAWPKIEFSFTGTGFDLISLTDDSTGAFEVIVYKQNADGTTERVERNVIDTYYGYSYGRLYSDANGDPSLDESGEPMYKSVKGNCTSAVRYYDKNGAISESPAYLDISGTGYTDTPTYYDADGNLTETETENPAYSYAYAYGWVKDTDSETLYQIPVIKIEDLEYGKYDVEVIPTFTSLFGHYNTDENGDRSYRVYFDAIRIYEPAGVGDAIADSVISESYKTDDEMYPSFIEMKEMLIGANSLAEDTSTQGVIFIDGIAASDNNLDTYKTVGPNNELYLAKDQAVAYEIWATAVPTDIQIGAKLAFGNPSLSIVYNTVETKIDIATASDIYYSFNNELPDNAKLTWQQVEQDGKTYYTSGTVVIQNSGAEDCVLSITNLKWTFSQYGEEGYFRIPTSVEDEELVLMSSLDTEQVAYASMSMLKADLDVSASEEEPVVSTDENGNSVVTMTVSTSTDVYSLIIKDADGNIVTPVSIESVINSVDNNQVKEWTVTLAPGDDGTYTYYVSGAYVNGYTGEAEKAEITVTVESDNEVGNSFFEALVGIYEYIKAFILKLLELFGIVL